jgi:acetyl esterase
MTGFNEWRNEMQKIFFRIFIALLLIVLSITHTYAKTIPAESNSPKHTYKIAEDVEWAKPNGHRLTMDIYTPNTGKSSYPVLIIFHGGGWLINNNSVMDSMSIYIASHAEYVVCNVNYRLLVDQNNTVTMNQIIEDVMGAILWIKDNIAAYKGDPAKLAVTGDSAGGHLAEMIVVCGEKLESDGFAGNSLGFKPTYLPEGQTAEQVAENNGLAVQAALISYGAFDIHAACSGNFESEENFFWTFSGTPARGIFGDSINVTKDPHFYKAVSPVYNIPDASIRKLPPQLFTVGSEDMLVTPASVQAYISKLEQHGHPAEYWVHQGRPHAFLDSGRNEFLGTAFGKDAIPALNRMLEFLHKYLPPADK